ncbi:SDR family oxidoreductase [Kocuria sp. JC486]|uniref:SDR family oxidoreductase n=1 Tax=Kocuria soli TaxID=2485125 RepID=A0A3N3ZVD2_9MICC|nr:MULTISPECIES: SDR family oxidoreductase [Kocuria]NHU85971.1 SDR family oxidoreductase [Kocuria sp. JC486]ROZ65766.1 SDR family oxidoreductase [Kocuria soli]
MTNVALIGGHGKVALLAAPLLIEAGDEVSSWIRNPEHAADVEATGARAVVLDVQHASTEELTTAFEGIDVVVWSAGAGGGDPERTWAVDRDAAIRTMDAAEKAGVGRYVMVSYIGAGPDHGIPEDNSFFAYAQSKAEADAHLRESSLRWTILGPGTLTLEEPTGKIAVYEPGEEPERAETSRGNVARTIVAAVHSDNSVGRTINYTDGDQPVEDVFGQS